MSNVTPEDIASQVRPALTKLYVMYFRLANHAELTGPQLTILGRLADDGPSRVREMAKLEGIRMPTASNAIHQLEERGLVARVRDTADRRGVTVQITEEGSAKLREVGAERDEQLAQLLQRLDPDDLEAAEKFVPVILRLADTFGPDNLGIGAGATSPI